jgi:hypothetical protein
VLALDALLLQIGCFVSLTASYMIAVSKIGYDTVCMAWRGGLGALAGLLFVSLFVVGPHRMSPLGTPFLLSWYPAWFNPGYFLFWLRACGLSLLMTVIMILIVAVRRHRSPHTLTSQETMV